LQFLIVANRYDEIMHAWKLGGCARTNKQPNTTGENMTQRAMKLLGALAVLAGFFFAAPAAYAYDPPPGSGCFKFPANPAPTETWPRNGHFFACSPSTPPSSLSQRAQQVLQTADLTTPPALKTKLTQANVDLFVFFNAIAYDIYPDFSTDVIGETSAQVQGFTIISQGAGHPAPVIAVFEATGLGAPVPIGDIPEITAHEIGHALDFAVFPSPALSSRATWSNLLLADFQDFDALGSSVQWLQLPANCTNQTSNTGKFVCEEHSKDQQGVYQPRETFANEYANAVNAGNLPPDITIKINGYFRKGGSNPPSTKYRSRDYVSEVAKGQRQP
jgi:hypothetical protein